MYSVNKNPRRSSNDILIFGLCSGCLWMSVTCGSQCLANVIYGYFVGGRIACKLEAIAHVSAILVQFFCVSLIAMRSYLEIVHNYKLSIRVSVIAVISVWMVCIVTTCCLSLVSPIYLMSAGTYCFFEFRSPAIADWLLTMLLLATFLNAFCYQRIFSYVKRHTARFKSMFPDALLQPSPEHKPIPPPPPALEPSQFCELKWRSLGCCDSRLPGMDHPRRRRRFHLRCRCH